MPDVDSEAQVGAFEDTMTAVTTEADAYPAPSSSARPSRRQPRRVELETSFGAFVQPAPKTGAQDEIVIHKVAKVIVSWNPTHSLADLPADILRHIAELLWDDQEWATRCYASTCRTIEDAAAPIIWELLDITHQSFRLPSLPLQGLRGPRDDQNESVDRLKVFITDILPHRREHLRYLFVDDPPDRDDDFLELFEGTTRLRYLSLVLRQSSLAVERISVVLATLSSIKSFELGIAVNEYSYGDAGSDVDFVAQIPRLLQALPDLGELTLSEIMADRVDSSEEDWDEEIRGEWSMKPVSAAIWSLPRLHTLTVKSCSPLIPPAPGAARPALQSLFLLMDSGKPSYWTGPRPQSLALVSAFPSLTHLTGGFETADRSPISLPRLVNFDDTGHRTSIDYFVVCPIVHLSIVKPEASWDAEVDEAPVVERANIDTIKLCPRGFFGALKELNVRSDGGRAADWDLDGAWIDDLYDCCRRRGVELFVDDMLIEAE